MPENNELHRVVGELTGTMKSLVSSVDALRTDVKEGTKQLHDRVSEQSKRVQTIEKTLAEQKGDTAARKAMRGGVLALFGGSIGAWAMRVLDKIFGSA